MELCTIRRMKRKDALESDLRALHLLLQVAPKDDPRVKLLRRRIALGQSQTASASSARLRRLRVDSLRLKEALPRDFTGTYVQRQRRRAPK